MKIVIHCGTGGPDYPWGPESIEQGIGGSEEAVINIARELTALGHEVFVYNRHYGGAELLSNGFWLNVGKHLPCIATPNADIFIAWRNWRFFEDAPNNAKKYLWCHDIPVEPHWNPEALQHFDKIILLNEYHRKRYDVPPERAFVYSNGVNLSDFDHGMSNHPVERVPAKCIYFSHPHRGLQKLREYWPAIREAVPHATLHAFWWQPEFFLEPNEALGIMPMRSLGHRELAREILSSDLFTYPSVFDPEINPITCIKAQVGGAWPVTVNCGGMNDTLIESYYARTSHENYVDNAVKWLRDGFHDQVRDLMMGNAQERFDWKRIAKRWSDEFEKEVAA